MSSERARVGRPGVLHRTMRTSIHRSASTLAVAAAKMTGEEDLSELVDTLKS